MYDRVKLLYNESRIDLNGLNKAVTLGWITEEQKQEIIDTKPQ